MKYIQWVDVNKRKPDQELSEYRERWGENADCEFIVFIQGAAIPTMLAYDGYGFYAVPPCDYEDDEPDYYEVTHWMCMPPAPSECRVERGIEENLTANFEQIEAFLT